jgi:hypothetical protein
MGHTMRIFRTTPQAYEAIRAQIDAAFGYPYFSDPENPTVATTESCMAPVENAIRDEDGNAYIALADEHSTLPQIAPALAALLADGTLTETELLP